MLNEKNCPHLVIGMPSHAPKSEASRFFALATRALKQKPESLFTVEQMTTALSAVESGGSGEYTYFAIPADPTAVTTQMTVNVAGSFCDTADSFLAAIGTTIPENEREEVSQVALNYALGELLSWNFESSLQLSREVLRLSRVERRRDEALNLSAAAYYLLGEPEKALDALKHAVEGEWNLELQANLSIVATDLDPQLAVSQMRFLIDNAPSGEMKLEAAMKAVGLWRSTQEELTGSPDEQDHAPIPRDLLDSVQEVLKDPEISENDFFSLGMFLADNDSERLKSSEAFAQSRWFNTASGQIVLARADGLGNYFTNVVRIAAEDPRELPWVEETLEHLVGWVNSAIMAEEGDFAASMGFNLLDQGLKITSLQRLVMCGLVVRSISKRFIDSDDLPNEKFFELVNQSRQALDELEQELGGGETTDFVHNLINLAADMLAAIHHDFHISQLERFDSALAGINYQMGGFIRRMSVDRAKVSEVCRSIRQLCTSAEADLKQAQEISKNSELRIAIAELRHRISVTSANAIH